METLREYTMKGDGVQAPGAIVLRKRELSGMHPYVVHFRNDQDGGYYHGRYCDSYFEALDAFESKVKRYDPSGILFEKTLRNVRRSLGAMEDDA